MASFVLLALGGERRQMEGPTKYVTLNLLSTALFLTAIVLALIAFLSTVAFAYFIEKREAPWHKS